jgi:hypothetical protein
MMMEPEDERIDNYRQLKEILENGLEKAGAMDNLHECKGVLIDIQQHFKGLKLFREDREELYNRLQEAFQEVNLKIEAEKQTFEIDAEVNYNDLSSRTSEVLKLFNQGTDTRTIWNRLIEVQNEVRNKKLRREDRSELLEKLQDAFSLIKMEREDQQQKFRTEANISYQKLKKLVEEGLRLAEESHEYKETREFLKKIQSEFKGVKMVHEQREELYSRLQTAFDILSARVNDFFHNKKKNWETKMSFTISRFDAENFELQQNLDNEKQYLGELYDQLDILTSAGRDQMAILALKARITSVENSIELKIDQIQKNQNDRDELKLRLEQ